MSLSDTGGKIRPGVIYDYFSISEISREVFSIYGDYTAVLPNYLLAEDVDTFVYDSGGDVAGFIQVHFEREELKETGELHADILSAAVAPGHQGQRVGSEMFKHVLQYLKKESAGADRADVQLTVAHTNTRAMAFFRRMGFELDGRELGSYSEGQRALIMSRTLLED